MRDVKSLWKGDFYLQPAPISRETEAGNFASTGPELCWKRSSPGRWILGWVLVGGDTGVSCRCGYNPKSSWPLRLCDFSSGWSPFVDDSQEMMESWASEVACPCGFGPILMFLKLLHKIKKKIPAQLLSDPEKLPETSRFSFIKWNLALNVFKFKKKLLFPRGYLQKRRSFPHFRIKTSS